MRRILLLLLIIAAAAQSRAGRSSISGHVKTATGKALDSVTVTLNAANGWRFTVRADQSGYFSVTGLDARNYTATLSRRGYESKRYIDIRIDSGTVAHLALNANLGAIHSKDSRLTTAVYQHAAARAIAPGHWLAKDQPGNVAKSAVAKTADGRSVKTAMEIERTATRSTTDIAALSAPSYKSLRSAEISIGGGRAAAPAMVNKFASASETAHIAADVKAGSLTCGEINDFAKWTLWEDVSYKQLERYQEEWRISPDKRVSVLVKASNGMPLANASVALLQFGSPIWEAKTDNTGKAELWYEIFGTEREYERSLALRVRAGGAEQIVRDPSLFEAGINVFKTALPCRNSQKIDLAFLVDATGSMGDEISYLKAELGDILQRVSDSMPLTNVRTGAVFYRDRGDAYLVRSSLLTDSFGLTQSFIADNGADGGGDGPEAVETALEAGLELGWRPDATARIAFLVLDAPPHGDSATFVRLEAMVRAYAARGIRLVPVACSGADKPTEYLLRAMALATNGTYLFLTDHSGIGGAHTAPTTDRFDVELLNQLIYRVIRNFSTMPECEALQLASISDEPRAPGEKQHGWRFYPNPTQDMLYVDHDEKTGFLYVTDISGKLVQRIAVNAAGHTSVDMRQFPAGMYSIRHSWGKDQNVAGTFILQK